MPRCLHVKMCVERGIPVREPCDARWPREMGNWCSGCRAPRVLLVGELNPYGANPFLALYHLPRGASGDRLREILGLADAAYARRLAKVNLCTGRWSDPRARAAAQFLLDTTREEVLVLLGCRVREAFGGPAFFEQETRRLPDLARPGQERTRVLVTIPHPSGRNLLWNDPDAGRRARAVLLAAAPWVYSEAGGSP